MEILAFNIIDAVLHFDKYLRPLANEHPGLVCLIACGFIFFETGVVIFPFLPGDSLLFFLGTLVAIGSMNLPLLLIVLSAAAILGNDVNYRIGRFIGPKAFHKESGLLWKKEYLERTHKFYEKHGGMTICIARFMPIIRTFAPFVAGIGKMSYFRFALYNVAAGVTWVVFFVMLGFVFGNIPFVKKNYETVILAIVLISILPGIIAFGREKMRSARNPGKEKPRM